MEKTVVLKGKKMKDNEKHCKDCVFFSDTIDGPMDHGQCHCAKLFVSELYSLMFISERTDTLVTKNDEKDDCLVGKYFGCVHFESKNCSEKKKDSKESMGELRYREDSFKIYKVEVDKYTNYFVASKSSDPEIIQKLIEDMEEVEFDGDIYTDLESHDITEISPEEALSIKVIVDDISEVSLWSKFKANDKEPSILACNEW